MDDSVLENSTLFRGVPAKDLRAYLEETPHHIQCYDKEETIFHLMDPALKIVIILEGRVEAQKSFPNGSQVNVSVRIPGELIGPAAVFSKSQHYPCDIVALEPTTLMVFQKEDLLSLMQKDVHILQNFTTEIASATYMLQQRLELLSYNGIAQKAAFWLLKHIGCGSDLCRKVLQDLHILLHQRKKIFLLKHHQGCRFQRDNITGIALAF